MCQGTFHCCYPMTQVPDTLTDKLFSTKHNREVASLAFLLRHESRYRKKPLTELKEYLCGIPLFQHLLIFMKNLQKLCICLNWNSREREVRSFNLHPPAQWPGSCETEHISSAAHWCCSSWPQGQRTVFSFVHQFAKELKTPVFSPDLSQAHCTAATAVAHRHFQPFLCYEYFKHINYTVFLINTIFPPVCFWVSVIKNS